MSQGDDADVVRLNQSDKEEWWDVARACKPDITREEFDAQWEEFGRAKAAKAKN